MRLIPLGGGRHEVELPRISVDHPAVRPFDLERSIPAPGGRSHQMARGDTLQTLAKRFYGGAEAWPRLYAANRALIGSDPAGAAVGQVLSVPY